MCLTQSDRVRFLKHFLQIVLNVAAKVCQFPKKPLQRKSPIRLLYIMSITQTHSTNYKRILVFPAASSPNINILISLLPKILDSNLPILMVGDEPQ